MTRNGSTIPFPKEFMTPPSWSSHTEPGKRGSSVRTSRRSTARGYIRRRGGGALVGDAAGAEPQGGELRLSVLRRDAARDERARADRAGRRRLTPAPRP